MQVAEAARPGLVSQSVECRLLMFMFVLWRNLQRFVKNTDLTRLLDIDNIAVVMAAVTAIHLRTKSRWCRCVFALTVAVG